MTNTWYDAMAAMAEHSSACLEHEESLSKQPYNITEWLLYLDALDEWLLEKRETTDTKKATAATNDRGPLVRLRDLVGRRAVQHLPRSYKLWKRQWEFCLREYHHTASQALAASQQQQQTITAETVVACFEQAVTTLSSFPRVWMVYLEFLLQYLKTVQQSASFQGEEEHESNSSSCPFQISCTTVRRTMNRALQALPVTQHDEKLWKPVLLPALLLQSNEATLPVQSRACLLQRYTYLKPSFQAEFGAWCEQQEQWGKAAVAYQSVLLSSNNNQSADNDVQEIWQAFGNLCSQHSPQVESVGIPWQAILRSALQAASSEPQHAKTRNDTGADDHLPHIVPQQQQQQQVLLQGMIYSWLANAWVRRGEFDLARSVYEEGLTQVSTVRDFSVLYEAYLQLEEGLLEHAVESLEEQENDDELEAAKAGDNDDWDILLGTTATSPLADMELAMARAEHLTRRRPLMLNHVLLRQNPNNIEEWLNRAQLFVKQGQAGQAASTLQVALETVKQNPNHGTLSELVVQLVAIHVEELKDVDRARGLLEQICQHHRPLMTKSDDLAACWATWIELELQDEQWDVALGLARQSVAPINIIGKSTLGRRLPNLTKSLRLWDLLLDLEESLGTVQTTKDAYNRAIEIKAATVQHILNFTAFLTQHDYFEESFAAYERGVELFAFPHAGAKVLWKAYLKAFINRFKGTKVERTRDLFQRCLERCPAEECAEFYMMNGEFEEEHGLTKRALSVYSTMCHKVIAKEKLTAYQLCIVKTTKYLGVTATRDIYQEAMESLEDQAASKICMEFAQMEASLQQIERSRAILTYGAQMADPLRLPEYWKAWNDFEIANGNEETFREMLRVKRSVEAAFSTANYNAAGMSRKAETLSQAEALRMIASQEGVDIVDEAPKTAVVGFVSSKRTAAVASLDDVEERVAKLRKATAVREAEEDGDENEEEIDIDDIDAEIEEAAAEGAAAIVQDFSTKAVPTAVFGGLAHEAKDGSNSKGALTQI